MNTIPHLFARQILEDCIVRIFGQKESKAILSVIPQPTAKESNVDYVLELVGFVNADNRYKLCCVNRRGERWAVFILTPYGVVRTSQISLAFGWPYEAKYDAVIFDDIQSLADALEDVGFNSTVIVEAFIDDYNHEV